MENREKLLKELSDYASEEESEEVEVLEETYSLSTLKNKTQDQILSDLEYSVIGDHVSSVGREEIMSKYDITKSQLNTILRKQKSKELVKELSREKHEQIKSRLVGVLSEQAEDLIELIQDKKSKGENVEKLNFLVFGTSSLLDVYEKLGKMDKGNEDNTGSNVLNLINELHINNQN